MSPESRAKRGPWFLSRVTLLFATLRWVAKAESPAAAVLQNLLTQFALIFVSFGTGVIIARNLGAAGRGELAALTLWPLILAGLFSFGVPTALVYHCRRHPAEQASLFLAAIMISGAASVLMMTTGFIVVPRALHTYDGRTIHWALALMFVAPQVLMAYTVGVFFQIRGEFAFLNKSRYLPALTTLIALLILLYFQRLTPESAALCYLAPPIPMFAFSLYRISRISSFSIVSIRSSILKLLNYGSRAAGIDLLSTLSSQVDQFLIVSFLSPSTMGAYVVALSISRILNINFLAVNMVLAPELVGRSPLEMTEYLGRSVRIALFLGATGAVIMAAVVPEILPRLYGKEFVASIPVVFVLLGEVLLSGTTSAVAEAFKASGRPGLVTSIEAATLGATVLLMLVILPRMGILGAAISLITASALRLCLILAFYYRVVGAKLPRFIVRPSDLIYAFNRLALQLERARV